MKYSIDITLNNNSFTFTFGLNERPPWGLALLYSLQWVLLLFPALITSVSLCSRAFGLTPHERILFSELTFLSAGFFTFVQSLWGHGYPILEGPAMAHLLTMLLLAPLGIKPVQFGMIVGGICLSVVSLFGGVSFLRRLFSRNIVVVVLMLVAFAFVPYLAKNMAGYTRGGASVTFSPWVNFSLSVIIVLFTIMFSVFFKGFWKTLSMLAGICFGSAIYWLAGLVQFAPLTDAGFFAIPSLWTSPFPEFSLVAALSCAVAYVAVVVNLMGSVVGVAYVVSDSEDRLNGALKRCLVINGLSGIVCGFLGIVGIVSYSISPGVILLQRVASRYVLTVCGALVVMMGLFPKLSGLCASIPSSVVSSVLCVALGSQIGAALRMIKERPFSQDDALVVGLSVILGTIVSVIPDYVMVGLPDYLKLFLKNGLAFGTFVAIFLEHVVFRIKAEN